MITLLYQTSIAFMLLLLHAVNSSELVVRIPKFNPSQATTVLLQSGMTLNEDASLTDIRVHISDTNNYCVNVEGVDIVTSTTFDLPSKCTLSVASTTTNETEYNQSNNDECFNIVIASGNDAQASITEIMGVCNTAFANGIRARATIALVESHNNATAIGEDAKAIIHSSNANNTAIAIGNRCLAEITESHNDNIATTNGNDAQSKVVTGYYSFATAGLNATTDTGNNAIANGTMANAKAVNGTYNFANALHSNSIAIAGDGNYNKATAADFSTSSTATGGDSNTAIADGVGTTATASSGSFNVVNATGIGSVAQAISGDGNTLTAYGMKAYVSSKNGNYNQLDSDGIMAHAEVSDGDRNVVKVNGTMSFGTISSSSDSQVLCDGGNSFGRCDMSSRSIVTATNVEEGMDGYVNATIIGGSDNTATAQATNSTVTIIDSGSYNHATANTNECDILISNGNVGGETQTC